VKSYGVNNSGVGYGPLKTFTTPQQGNGNCNIVGLRVFQTSGLWYFEFNLNSNCQSYTVELITYANNPTTIQKPKILKTTMLNSLNSYQPTVSESLNGKIQRKFLPQPSGSASGAIGPGVWYGINVKCNGICNTTNVTKNYFYVIPSN